MVDSADDSQLLTSKIEFFNLLVNNDLVDASILILANKQDLPGSKTSAELTEAYNLHEIQNHSWKIQGCCALTGDGLEEGLDWLTNQVLEKQHNKAKGNWNNPVNYLMGSQQEGEMIETYEQRQNR